MIKAIVCTDNDWGIGLNGELLFHFAEDMKLFKDLTVDNIVVMGRKTFESLPNKKPLPFRRNIVMTKHQYQTDEQITLYDNINDVLLDISQSRKTTWVIGGEQIYYQFLSYCNQIYRTRVDTIVDADKYFPDISQISNWKLDSASDWLTSKEDGIKFRFEIYTNLNQLSI